MAVSEVTCPNCQRVNRASNAFCTGCGVGLTTGEVPAGDTQGDAAAERQTQEFRAEIAAVRNQLRDTGTLLNHLQTRIFQLERGLSAPVQRLTTVDDPQPDTLDRQTETGSSQASDAPVQEPFSHESPSPRLSEYDALEPVTASASQAPPPIPPGPSAGGGGAGESLRPAGFAIDWEQILGRNWFAIIGAVTLVLGIGFFLKLAFDNNWIGDTGRVVLGVVLGLALLGIGEFARRRVPIWSQPVTAGGAAILYLSIYAAFGLYQLIRPDVAFLFLAMVVALAGLLALRYESIVIAVLGIVGAFLAPILLGPSLPDVRLVLLYILVVDLGVLGVSTFRNWRWFTMLAWVGSYGLFVYWLGQFPDFDPILIQLALTGVFAIFAGASTLFHIIWRRVPGPLDMGLMAVNATAFFALTVALLWEDYEILFGLISLALALFYGLISLAAIKRSGAHPHVALIALPMALVFLTVAMPLQLSGVWVTVAWAAQGTILVWLGFLLNRWQMRVFGLGVLALSVGHLLLFDSWVELERFTPIINERLPVFLSVIAAFYVSGYLFWRYRESWKTWEPPIVPVLLTVANLLTVGLLSLEVIGYFGNQAVEAGNNPGERSAVNGTLLTLTAMWAIYGFILLGVGMVFRSFQARWGGLALMGVVVAKLLVFDTPLVGLEPTTYVPFLNVQFLTFVIVLALMLAAAFWTRLWRDNLPGTEARTFIALLIVANVVAVWSLSLEVIHYFDYTTFAASVDYVSGMHLSLTVLWAVYAIGVIGVGIATRSSKIRLGGMAFLAVPVIKLFVFDVFLLELGYRVAAFITLGVLLLGTGLAYQGYSQAMRGFLFGRRS